MMDLVGKLISPGPRGWSRRARHIFILTFPVSFPLWLCAIFLIAIVAMALDLFIPGCRILRDMWREP
jgi:hypothetical protein